MGGRKCIGNLHESLKGFPAHRNAVSQKDHRPAAGIEILSDLADGNDALRAHRRKAQAFRALFAADPLVNAGVNLLAARIHQRTDQAVRRVQIIGDGIHCGDRYDRPVHGQRCTLCRCRTDPQSRKGSGSFCDGDGIHCLKIQFQHTLHLIHHGDKALGMFLFILNIVVRDQKAVLKDCTACDRTRSFDCQYFHIFLCSCQVSDLRCTVILR